MTRQQTAIAALEAATVALHHARAMMVAERSKAADSCGGLASGAGASIDYRRRDRVRLISPDEVADFMRDRLRGLAQEELYAIFLNSRNEVIATEMITRGLVDRTSIHAREVFRPAIQYGAVKLLLVHNHPAGDPSPSQGDIRSTRELVEAGKIIGIELMDHVILGDRTESRSRDWASLRELGYM